MSPEEAWALFNRVGGRRLLPIHWRTFILAPRDVEPVWEPIERLSAAAGGRQDVIVGEEPGATLVLPPS